MSICSNVMQGGRGICKRKPLQCGTLIDDLKIRNQQVNTDENIFFHPENGEILNPYALWKSVDVEVS